MGAAVFRPLLLGTALLTGACTSINANERTFEDTRWQVTAVNGQQTPRTHMYQVRFSDGQMLGRFGCNHFSGPYKVRKELMTVTNVASTLIGCPEPAATHEAQAFAVLGRPMRMKWDSGQRLGLSNEVGSITLQRS